jgi:hypothetical protein
MTTVAADNSKHGAFRAMAWVAVKAQPALAAPGIYFTDNPFANEFGRIARFLDNADKLVTDRSRKSGVAAHDLQVRIANAGHGDADERFVFIAGRGNVSQP